MKSENDICKFLEWDSNFFNVRIAILQQKTLTTEILNLATAWCLDNKIDCLYFLADSKDKQTIELAKEHNFNLTDIKITLETKLEDSLPIYEFSDSMVQSASFEDIDQLKQIASVNHRDSRFYYDGNFTLQKCNELFATWIEKSCKGYADIVLVGKTGKTVQGYITCSIDSENKGNVGLVGVNPNYQGKGMGKLLVTSALEWFRKNYTSVVTVVTQGRNIKAQRLYQRNGFVTKTLEIWYHKWFD